MIRFLGRTSQPLSYWIYCSFSEKIITAGSLRAKWLPFKRTEQQWQHVDTRERDKKTKTKGVNYIYSFTWWKTFIYIKKRSPADRKTCSQACALFNPALCCGVLNMLAYLTKAGMETFAPMAPPRIGGKESWAGCKCLNLHGLWYSNHKHLFKFYKLDFFSPQTKRQWLHTKICDPLTNTWHRNVEEIWL